MQHFGYDVYGTCPQQRTHVHALDYVHACVPYIGMCEHKLVTSG